MTPRLGPLELATALIQPLDPSMCLRCGPKRTKKKKKDERHSEQTEQTASADRGSFFQDFGGKEAGSEEGRVRADVGEVSL